MDQTLGPSVPAWAWNVLAAPGSGAPLAHMDGAVLDAARKQWATVADGIISFPLPADDPSIRYYDSIGGTHFVERSAEPYAMSSLDTPVYHQHLRAFAPPDLDSIIVDVGGGDGRNTTPWLQWGYRRVILVEPIRSSLLRFRQRLAGARDWWDRVVLVQADARQLPLLEGCASRILAIETVCYLNEDAGQAIAECFRVLANGGQFLISARDYETGLLIRALHYGGAAGMLALGRGRDVWDGVGNSRIRNRCYTREELIAAVTQRGFHVQRIAGISALSVILGFLRGIDRLGDDAPARLPEIRSLLSHLAEHGSFMRAHVVFATPQTGSRANDGARTLNKTGPS